MLHAPPANRTKPWLIQATVVVGWLFALSGLASAEPPASAPADGPRQPSKALLLQLDREQWQALVAVCVTPAFYSRTNSTPLIFDDGSERRDLEIPHDTLAVKQLGKDAPTATAALARKYWTKAETIFVVEDYEQALWVVPSAAFLSAPIMVQPDEKVLKDLGVTRAVTVGKAAVAGVKDVVNLADKKAVWQFQVKTMADQKVACDYIVITNPTDTADKLDSNIQWPYLSPAAAPLAAYRRALVQTGNYTGDRQKLNDLGVSLGDKADAEKLASVMPVMKRVKADCAVAAKFLTEQGQKPRFLGMVGGSIALPYYFIDLHAKYTFWNISIDYVPADTPYATLRDDVDFTRFVKPDLAVGRIMADSVRDATWMLARTFFRKEYLPGGKYADLAVLGWEKRALVYDGHRLNQPDEGGPNASPDEPFHPAAEVAAVFRRAGLSGDYVFPRDETKRDSKGVRAPELFSASSDNGFVQYVAHGDPPFLRIEAGRTGRDMKNYLATGTEYRRRLNFKSPTTVYVIGCNVGTVNANFKTNEEYLPTSAIHAGAVAYMAPNKCQAICFWRYAPKGPGADQAILFWENALTKRMSIGESLIDAKWRAHETWAPKQGEATRDKDSDNCIEIDAPSMVLFGDPALTIAE
jgi:hypothetical protein